jgi:hypothetical protein
MRTIQVLAFQDVAVGDILTVYGPYVCSEPMTGEVVDVSECSIAVMGEGGPFCVHPSDLEKCHVRIAI